METPLLHQPKKSGMNRVKLLLDCSLFAHSSYNENKTIRRVKFINFVAVAIVLVLFLATRSTNKSKFDWF